LLLVKWQPYIRQNSSKRKFRKYAKRNASGVSGVMRAA
jgi:hypothetical protein